MHPAPAVLGSLRHAALRWSPDALRKRWAAAHALSDTLHALVHQRLDPQVAAPKLAWWQEEVVRFGKHQATLPALQALQEWQATTQNSPAWLQQALDGVVRFREQVTPITTQALCQQWAQWGHALWWPCAHEGVAWSPEERAYLRALGALDVGMRWCDQWVLGHPDVLWILPHDVHLAHGLKERCSPQNAAAYHQAWCAVLKVLMATLEALPLQDAPNEAVAIAAEGVLLLARKRVRSSQASLPRVWPLPLLWRAWRTHTAYRSVLA